MPDDFDALFQEAWKILKTESIGIYQQIRSEQIPIVENAMKVMARAMVATIIEPKKAEQHRDTVNAAKSVIASEANLAAIKATNAFIESLKKAALKLGTLAISMV